MKAKTGRHYEKSPVDYLLTGKAYCGHCGKPMVGDSGTGKSGATHYYYTCQAHKRRAGCSKKSLRKNLLEDMVINFLMDECLTGPEMEKIADAIVEAEKARLDSSPLASMEAELRSVVKKIDNINTAIENGIWNSSTSARLKSLEDTADSLRSSISVLQYAECQLIDRDRVLFFLERFRKMDRTDPEDRRLLINTFLNVVYVFDDHLKIVINAVEGNLTVPLEAVPDPPPCSDTVRLGLPATLHPNTFAFCYMVRM